MSSTHRPPWFPSFLAALMVLALSVAPLASASQSREGKSKPRATSSAPAAKTKSQLARQPKDRAVKAQAVRQARPAAAGQEVVPVSRSLAHQIGLHRADDPLSLKSSVALVIDQDTDEVLLSKNPEAVLPIASITKLMTAVVVTDAGLPLDEELSVTTLDALDTGKSSSSRLAAGARLSRGELLHLALMASENRAAMALGANFPGGMPAFVEAMNRKAAELGMRDTRYVEPTGLSSDNRSSAKDLSVLVKAAMQYPLIRELSTTPEAQVAVGSRQLQFRNTNGLVRNPEWEIGVQKTGYISEAGRCLVMQASLAGRNLIMVLLDSAGKYSRIGDAERIRKWLLQSASLGGYGRPLS